MSTPRNTGSTPLRASRIARVVTALGRAVVVGGLATIVACSDTPSEPSSFASVAPAYNKEHAADHPGQGKPTSMLEELGVPLRVKALLRDVPLRESQTRSFKVSGAEGGMINWPEVGLKVIVPRKGIKAKDMTITVTALAGDVIAYDFGPDGSQFDVPLVVTQSLKGTNFARLGAGARVRGAYFRNASLVNDVTNTVLVDAFQPSELDGNGRSLTFKVTHFSGYMVSMD